MITSSPRIFLYQFKKYLLLLSIIVAIAGCGAPTKRASEVKGLFQNGAPELQGKMDDLCSTLLERDKAPSLKNTGFQLSYCDQAGTQAVEFGETREFYFTGLDSIEPGSQETIETGLRAQVWLNRSVISLASQVLDQLEAGGIDIFSERDDSSGRVQNLVDVRIQSTRKPRLDSKAVNFGVQIDLQTSGIVEVFQQIDIDGMILDRSLAITVNGKIPSDKTKEDSFVKTFNGFIVIIPHSQDIYLDMALKIELFDLGLGDIVKDAITNAVGGTLKTGLESFFAVPEQDRESK